MSVGSHAAGNEFSRETKFLSDDGAAGKMNCSRIVTPVVDKTAQVNLV